MSLKPPLINKPVCSNCRSPRLANYVLIHSANAGLMLTLGHDAGPALAECFPFAFTQLLDFWLCTSGPYSRRRYDIS